MRFRAICGFAGSVAMLAFSACAARNGGLPSSPFSQSPAATRAAEARGDSKVRVSGTYEGSVKEVEGSHERSGSVTVQISQSGRKISGTFSPTFSSGSTNLTINGSVKSDKAKKAKLVFIIEDPKGRNASATATVTAKKLVGKATVPPSGTKPGVNITFSTTRKKSDN